MLKISARLDGDWFFLSQYFPEKPKLKNANDNGEGPFAALRPDWLDIYKTYWMDTMKDPTPYWKDASFVALAERIEAQGRLIQVTFTAGDAFEKLDDNHWLPDPCFLSLPKPKEKS